MSGGFPCQPFSTYRQKTGKALAAGSKSRLSVAEDHPDYEMVTREFELFLARRSPHAFWIEEVEGFAKRLPKLGQSALDIVTAKARDKGYAVSVLGLNHSLFINVSRPRIFVFGCRATAGGVAGVNFVTDVIEAVTVELAKETRPSVFTLADVFSQEQIARRAQSKDRILMSLYVVF